MRKSSLNILIMGTLIVFAHGVCVAEGAPPDGMMIELLQGSSVNGIFFANLLDEAGFINSNKMLRFQVVQEIPGEIRLKVEVKRQMADGDIKKLRDSLMPFFKEVIISQHEFLDPGPSGKFRYIISKR